MQKKSVVNLIATGLSGLLIMAPVAPAVASAGSPSGVNIGFAMDWIGGNPVGSSASFLLSDGASLSNCDGDDVSSPTFQGCSFLYETEIDSVVEDSFFALANQPYVTTSTYDLDADDSLCQNNNASEMMLTNYNCFNDNSYGQIFRPTNSGSLTNFKMALSCLAPGPISLYAVLYNVDGDSNGSSITGNPLGSFKITLENCATSWQNYTFTQADFQVVNMDFGNPMLTSGESYGVYFAGEFIPGTQIIDVETLDSFVADAPTVEEAPVHNYRGPLLSSFSSRTPTAGDEVTITGRRLNLVDECTIDGIDVQISNQSADRFTILIPPGLEPGLKDLVMTGPAGKLTALGALTIQQPKAEISNEALASTKVNAGSFNGYVAVYAKGLKGKTLSWKIAGKWFKTTITSDYQVIKRKHLTAGREILVDLYVDGDKGLSKVVTTR